MEPAGLAVVENLFPNLSLRTQRNSNQEGNKEVKGNEAQRKFKLRQITRHYDTLNDAVARIKKLNSRPMPKIFISPLDAGSKEKRFREFLCGAKSRFYSISRKITELKCTKDMLMQSNYKALVTVASLSNQLVLLAKGILKFPDKIPSHNFTQVVCDACLDFINIVDAHFLNEDDKKVRKMPFVKDSFEKEVSGTSSSEDTDVVIVRSSEFNSFVKTLDPVSLKQKMKEIADYFVSKQNAEEIKQKSGTSEKASGHMELIQDSLTPIIRKNPHSSTKVNPMKEPSKEDIPSESTESSEDCSTSYKDSQQSDDSSQDHEKLKDESKVKWEATVDRIDKVVSVLERDYAAHTDVLARLSKPPVPQSGSPSHLDLALSKARSTLNKVYGIPSTQIYNVRNTKPFAGSLTEEVVKSRQNTLAAILEKNTETQSTEDSSS